jgi:hypothetical protein
VLPKLTSADARVRLEESAEVELAAELKPFGDLLGATFALSQQSPGAIQSFLLQIVGK